jgi:C1A family cysteine protease
MTFSEQDLVDCSKSYGNNGCNGGWTDYAYKYIRDKGIATQTDYPYQARDQACNDKVTRAQNISSFVDVPGCSELMTAVKSQPVSVGVDASNWSPYQSGVFDNCESSINHGVLLVGVANNSYWIVKNSWGTSWGENGFIRLGGGKSTCAICDYPSYPVL